MSATKLCGKTTGQGVFLVKEISQCKPPLLLVLTETQFWVSHTHNRGRSRRLPSKCLMHQLSRMIIIWTWWIGPAETSLQWASDLVFTYGLQRPLKSLSFMILDLKTKSQVSHGQTMEKIWLSVPVLEFSRIGMLSNKRWSESSMVTTEELDASPGTTLFWAVDLEIRAFSIETQEWKKIISPNLRDTSKKFVGLNGVQMSNSLPLEVMITN